MKTQALLTTAQLAAQLGIQARSIRMMVYLSGGSYRGVFPVKHKNRLYWPLDTVKKIQAIKEAKRAF